MISLPDLKVLILEYKKNRSPKVFADILNNLDYLIIYFIKKCRARFHYLRVHEYIELYHTSVIALNSACITYPDDMTEAYIPCRLRAYMLAEFHKLYRYIDIECVEFEQQHSQGYALPGHSKINLDGIDYSIVLDTLTKDEAILLSDYLSKKKQVKQLAKELNLSSSMIIVKVKNMMKKFK